MRLLTRLPQIRALAVFALTLLAFVPVVHAQGKLPGPVARALAQQGIPESAVAVYVHEVGARHPVIAAGAARPLNPASTMKLVTTWAALGLVCIMLGAIYTHVATSTAGVYFPVIAALVLGAVGYARRGEALFLGRSGTSSAGATAPPAS